MRSCLRLQHLNNLLENYLEPLKKETFLSNAEINALFGNIQEIVTFQRQFLQNLEEALEAEPNFHHFEFSNQFKVCTVLLFTLKSVYTRFQCKREYHQMNFLFSTEHTICRWKCIFVLRQSL